MARRETDQTPGAGTGAQRIEILSGFRLKARLTIFVTVLVAALCGMIFLLVTRIFDQMRPTLQDDLLWKAQRGAAELSQAAELGILLRDEPLIQKAFGDYRASGDIIAIVAVDAAGRTLAVHGALPEPAPALFQGAAGAVRAGPGCLTAWGETQVEGKAVGRVAIAVSTARLAAGDAFRRDVLGTAAIGGLLGLLLSIVFVQFYIGPLIRVTEQALFSLRQSQAEFAARQRLQKELEIGARIQTSILPRELEVPGLTMAASMLTASEVGGDYYDVLPTRDGAFIGIGDVAGHGLTAGLVMLMVQSAVAALTRQRTEAPPSEILGVTNEVIFENVRHRLRQDEHVTLSLLRYHEDGRVVFAGAHEEILIFRAQGRTFEHVETPGTWVGAQRDVRAVTVDTTLTLHRGDLMILYTDGITEARDGARRMFGLEGIRAVVEESCDEPVETIRARLVAAVERWSPQRDDDRTVLVLRHVGPASPARREPPRPAGTA